MVNKKFPKKADVDKFTEMAIASVLFLLLIFFLVYLSDNYNRKVADEIDEVMREAECRMNLVSFMHYSPNEVSTYHLIQESAKNYLNKFSSDKVRDFSFYDELYNQLDEFFIAPGIYDKAEFLLTNNYIPLNNPRTSLSGTSCTAYIPITYNLSDIAASPDSRYVKITLFVCRGDCSVK